MQKQNTFIRENNPRFFQVFKSFELIIFIKRNVTYDTEIIIIFFRISEKYPVSRDSPRSTRANRLDVGTSVSQPTVNPFLGTLCGVEIRRPTPTKTKAVLPYYF